MYTFHELTDIIEKLRSEEGCPWDRAQTYESLKPCLADETQEVFDAIDNQDMDNLVKSWATCLCWSCLTVRSQRSRGRLP